jgi:TonB family protein
MMRRALLIRGLAALLLTSVALPVGAVDSTPAPQRAVVITRPDWASLPSSDDVERYYPERAARMGQGGKATISCVVDEKGLLVDCALVSETPPGEGFGEAALRMSRLFRMKPKTVDGQPVTGAQVRIPIAFKTPEPEPLDEVIANLAKTVPLDGFYVSVGSPDLPYAPEYPSPYLRLPDRQVGKGTVEVTVFGAAKAPRPWGGSLLAFSYERVTYDCGKRRTRVNSTIFFDPQGLVLDTVKRKGGWMPMADTDWARDILRKACGDRSVQIIGHSGIGEVIAAVRNGERPGPPPALLIPPAPAPRS